MIDPPSQGDGARKSREFGIVLIAIALFLMGLHLVTAIRHTNLFDVSWSDFRTHEGLGILSSVLGALFAGGSAIATMKWLRQGRQVSSTLRWSWTQLAMALVIALVMMTRSEWRPPS